MTRIGHLRDTIIGLWGMSRPLVMTSNILTWLLGVSIASGRDHNLEVDRIVLSFITSMLVSASIHYTNEYADHETDALTTRTPYSGGSGVLPSGLVPRSLAMKAAWASLFIGLFVQLVAALNGVHPWSALAVIILGALGGWMYSLPPLRLGWRGGGEFLNASLGSNLLPFYGFITASGSLDCKVLLACLPVTLIAFTNLLAVTWPDRSSDEIVGKMTLATRWTPKRLRMTYRIAVLASFTSLILLEGWILPKKIILSSLPALPLLIWGAKTYTRNEISTATVYGMVVMIAAQTLAWFSLRLAHSI
ncbi:MAG: prenyltransferase [Candidatus Bathyarchaeota archaeon]|nr:MAG: prenyltransferase [Candidatus Bathyarchaeota archaeon]